MSEEDLDRINEDELNRSSQDSSPEIPEEQQDEKLLSRDVSEDKLNLPKSKAPPTSGSQDDRVRATNPVWECQNPLRHPHVFPKQKRPWDDYEGGPVEWFTSDPPDVLPAPLGWDGSPTRYYPGFGWVLPPIKPGYPYYIFPEDRGNPPGSIDPPIPDWDGGYPYDLPDPFDNTLDPDAGGLWGITDEGDGYYNLPGFGQWSFDPTGLGGAFWGDDGQYWEWWPPRGHENDPSYFNDPCRWEWRKIYDTDDPDLVDDRIHRNSEVPREQRLNLEVLSRSMNDIRAWSSSLSEIRSWKRISGSDLLSFNESTRRIPHRAGPARFKKTGTIGKKETPSFDLKSFAVDIPKDYRPVRTQEDAEVPLRSGATGSRGPAGSQGPRGPQGRQGERGPCCTGPDLTVDETGLTLYGYTLGIDPDESISVAGVSAAAITADIVHVKDQIKFANGMTAASVVTTVNGVSGDVTLVDLVGVATFNGAAGDVQGVSSFNGATGGITSSNLILHVAGLSCDGGASFGGRVEMTDGADILLGPGSKISGNQGEDGLIELEFNEQGLAGSFRVGELGDAVNNTSMEMNDPTSSVSFFSSGRGITASITGTVHAKKTGSHGGGISADGGSTFGSHVSMGASADIAGNLLVTGNLDVGTDTFLRKNVTHLGSSMAVPTNFDIDNANGETVIAIDTRNVRIGDCDSAGNGNNILVRDSHDVITLTSTSISTNADLVSLNAATVKIPDNLEHLGDANTKLSFPSADNLVLTAGGVTFAHGTDAGLYAPAGLSADGGVTFGSINTGGGLQVDGNIHTDGGISADGGISGGHVHCASLKADGAMNVTGVLTAGAFSGPLIGNASTATTAAEATQAFGVQVQGKSDDNDYSIIFADHIAQGGGNVTANLAAKVDSGTGEDGLIYNPSTDLLSLGGISSGAGCTFSDIVSIGATLDFENFNAIGTSGRWYLNQNGVNVGFLDQPNGLLRFQIYSMQTSRELAHLNDEDTFIRFPEANKLQLSAGGNVFVEGTATNVTVEGSTLDAGIIHTQGISAQAGSTFAGDINLLDNQVVRPKLKDYSETVNAIGTITGNTAIDFSSGNVQTVTGNGNCEFSFTNPPATGNAGTLTLLITNGGANTTTWASAVKWPGDVAPTLTASGIDILSFVTIDAGSNIYGFVGGINFS